MATMHAQVASLEAIRAANEQSAAVGHLTTLATVFLPLGLVAGIFSISGEYAVGGSRFWVFFAATIPLGIVIALLLFTGVARYLRVKMTPIFKGLRKVFNCHRSHCDSAGNSTDDIILPLFNKTHY